jgi:queuine/archaeosine tRNA-ribosyltransferase
VLLPLHLLQWLDECIQHHQTMQQQLQQQQQQQQSDAAAAAAAALLPDPQLFAAVMGAASEQERVRSAKAAAERDVAGVCACGATQKAMDQCMICAWCVHT